MIRDVFVTVGTQLPFDRLVDAVDAWAAGRDDLRVFAQVGAGRAPVHGDSAPDLDPAAFRRRLEAADLVIAHAGMGTLITAVDLGRPVIVLPRRADLGEHRNEHQRATAERLAHLDAVTVVEDAAALARAADAVLAGRRVASASRVDGSRDALIDGIRRFAGLGPRGAEGAA